MANNHQSLDIFTKHYIIAALWSTTDDNNYEGDFLDKNYTVEDIHADTLAKIIEDCAKFQMENSNDIGDRYEDAGHDFLLTRNHHGCGFWETPDWAKEAGERLTEAADKFGEFDLYVGDDCLIHCYV
jgi:hypothetical protein